MYEYALTLRPASQFSVPEGFSGFKDNSKYPFGIVTYEKPLTMEQIEHFSLKPLDAKDHINLDVRWQKALKDVDALTDYGAKSVSDGKNLYSPDVSKGGESWRLTRFEGGEPVGHVEFENYVQAREYMAGALIRGDALKVVSALDRLKRKAARLRAAITLDIEKGDEILRGKWQNQKEVVKKIGEDEFGNPTINGKPILKIRVPKLYKDGASLEESADIPHEGTALEKFLRSLAEPDANRFAEEVKDVPMDDRALRFEEYCERIGINATWRELTERLLKRRGILPGGFR